MLFFEIFFKICLAALGAMALVLSAEIIYKGEKPKREKAKKIEPETSEDKEGE